MLIAGVFNILWLLGVFIHVLDVKERLRTTLIISPFPYLILDVWFGGNNLVASLLALIFLVGIILIIAGGWLALKKNRIITPVGADGSFIRLSLLGTAAMIIVRVSNRNGKI